MFSVLHNFFFFFSFDGCQWFCMQRNMWAFEKGPMMFALMSSKCVISLIKKKKCLNKVFSFFFPVLLTIQYMYVRCSRKNSWHKMWITFYTIAKAHEFVYIRMTFFSLFWIVDFFKTMLKRSSFQHKLIPTHCLVHNFWINGKNSWTKSKSYFAKEFSFDKINIQSHEMLTIQPFETG